MRSYDELLGFSTLEERFRYLALHGEVGNPTFGSRRWMNQAFYTSREWRDMRSFIRARDNGCDLAVPGFDIRSSRAAAVHHINPITELDIENRSPKLLDPNNLVLVTHGTHNAIHYGDERLLPREDVERRPGDTKEW